MSWAFTSYIADSFVKSDLYFPLVIVYKLSVGVNRERDTSLLVLANDECYVVCAAVRSFCDAQFPHE